MNVFSFPLSRIAAAFVPGIICAHYFQPGQYFWTLAFCAFLIAAFVLGFMQAGFKKAPLFGAACLLAAFSAGATIATVDQNFIGEKHYLKITGNDEFHSVELRLTDRLKSSAKRQRYFAEVLAVDRKICEGKILVQMPPTAADQIPIGSILLVNGKIQRNRPPQNPGQFDFGKYLWNKGVAAQMYASTARTIGVKKDLWYYSDRIRNKAVGRLKSTGFGKDELQVVNALILGQQQEISAEILTDYQQAGAVHILSVSGLHVGFILFFLSSILKFLPKNRSGNTLKYIVILAGLWSFAILAGLAPSVLRSTVMFSFVATGMYIRRGTNVHHTLITSLLIILLFEPGFIFDVGFQLSYAALFFILWLQPTLAALWTTDNRIAKYFIDLITVSIAAQVGTFPLSIYYFHQFPGLFLLTNIVVIPLVSFIMALGLITLLLTAFNCTPGFVIWSLEKSIWLLDSIINKIASAESFILKNVPFSLAMAFASYFVIVAVVMAFKKPKAGRVTLSLISLIVFQFVMIFLKWETQRSHELSIYNLWKKTLITERWGENVSVYSASSEIPKPITPYLIENFARVEKTGPLPNVMTFNERKILIIDSSSICSSGNSANILILVQSPKINLNRLLQNTTPELVIADGSNFKSYVKRWKETCQKQKIPFHNTAEKGFYMIR